MRCPSQTLSTSMMSVPSSRDCEMSLTCGLPSDFSCLFSHSRYIFSSCRAACSNASCRMAAVRTESAVKPYYTSGQQNTSVIPLAASGPFPPSALRFAGFLSSLLHQSTSSLAVLLLAAQMSFANTPFTHHPQVTHRNNVATALMQAGRTLVLASGIAICPLFSVAVCAGAELGPGDLTLLWLDGPAGSVGSGGGARRVYYIRTRGNESEVNR